MQDISDSTILFTLAGPRSDDLIEALGAGSLVGGEEGCHAVFGAAGQPVVVSVARELGIPGYNIIASEGIGGDLWKSLVGQVWAGHAHAIICCAQPSHGGPAAVPASVSLLRCKDVKGSAMCTPLFRAQCPWARLDGSERECWLVAQLWTMKSQFCTTRWRPACALLCQSPR